MLTPFFSPFFCSQDLKFLNPQARLPRIPVLKEREIRAWLQENPYNPSRFEDGTEEKEPEPGPAVIPVAALAGDPHLLYVESSSV